MVVTWIRSPPRVSSVCGCVSCISHRAVQNPIRAPVKSGGRRTILFYSSIISTAAALDSAAKRKRREEWDSKIDELEKSIQSGAIAIDSLQRKTELPGNGRLGSGIDALLAAERFEASSPTSSWPANVPIFPVNIRRRRLNFNDAFQAAQELLKDPKSMDSGLILKSAWKVHPDSIHASPQRKSYAENKGWHTKKLLTVEYSVAKLAMRFILKASNASARKVKALETSLDGVQARINYIKSRPKGQHGNASRLEFPQYDARSSTVGLADNRARLNKAISRLFRHHVEGRISLEKLLMKLAYNLFISTVAPDSETYVLMISRFRYIGMQDLAEMAIESLREANIRLNEILATTILDHYIEFGPSKKFHHEVLKTHQGFYGGSMLAKPGQGGWKSPSLAVGHTGKRIQLLDFNLRTYQTIIRGYEKFGQWTCAAQWQNAMEADGFMPDAEFLNRRMENLTIHGQLDKGVATWHAIMAMRSEKCVALPLSREDLRVAYVWMLRLLRSCRRFVVFKALYKKGLTEEGFSMTDMAIVGVPEAKRMEFGEWEERKRRRLRIQILVQRFHQVQTDISSITIRILACKIHVTGLPVESVKRTFENVGQNRQYVSWLWQRPWVWNELVKTLPAPEEPNHEVRRSLPGRESRDQSTKALDQVTAETEGPHDELQLDAFFDHRYPTSNFSAIAG